jgi:hypothetical protein
MKRMIVGLMMVAGATSYGQEAPTPIVDESIKTEVVEPPKAEVVNPKTELTQGSTPTYTLDYMCQKGERKNAYRVSYKNREGVPPCKVYEVKDGGKTKKIGESQRTVGVCESILDRIVNKLEAAGMDCDLATIPD